MSYRPLYAISGLIVGAVGDIVVSLLAAGIQQRAFPGQFSDLSLGILVGLAVLGLLVGYWLGGPLQLPASSLAPSAVTERPETTTITRLRAILSYTKLRGKGIHLRDIFLIGSRIDIET
jgi:hypothetical protein